MEYLYIIIALYAISVFIAGVAILSCTYRGFVYRGEDITFFEVLLILFTIFTPIANSAVAIACFSDFKDDLYVIIEKIDFVIIKAKKD